MLIVCVQQVVTSTQEQSDDEVIPNTPTASPVSFFVQQN